MVFLVPLILVALYIGMYVLRTDRSPECRWRQVGKDTGRVTWRCQVCGSQAQTGTGEPKHCGARPRT